MAPYSIRLQWFWNQTQYIASGKKYTYGTLSLSCLHIHTHNILKCWSWTQTHILMELFEIWRSDNDAALNQVMGSTEQTKCHSRENSPANVQRWDPWRSVASFPVQSLIKHDMVQYMKAWPNMAKFALFIATRVPSSSAVPYTCLSRLLNCRYKSKNHA